MTSFTPKKPEKEVISLRIASDTLSVIDRCAAETEISRNELICQCIEYALAHMDPNKKE